MDLGSIFLMLALAVLISLFIGRPLFDRRTEDIPLVAREATLRRDHERSALLAEQERLLTALQELDFDHGLGKIPPEDYPSQRALLLQAGAAVLQKLDEMDAETGSQPGSETNALQRLEEVEAACRAGGQTAHVAGLAAASGEDELENMIASRRRARQERSAGFCTKCGQPVQKSDLFCSHCGMKIR